MVLYLSFPITLLFNALRKSSRFVDTDIILGTSGIVFNALAAFLLSKYFRKPFVFELRDITCNQILAVNGGQETFYYSLIRRIELMMSRKADHVVCLTDGFKRWLLEQGIDPCKITVIPNGMIPNRNTNNQDCPTQRIKQMEGKWVVAYFGTMGDSQDIPFWLEFMLRAESLSSRIHFLFIGDGSRAEQIRSFAENHDNCTYMSSLPLEELTRYYPIVHLGIVSLVNTPAFADTIPSKTFDTMDAAIPVLYHGYHESAVAGLLKEAEAGIVLPLDINEAVDDLLKALQHPNSLAKMGKAGHAFVARNYNRRTQARHYLELFQTVKKGA